MAKKRATKAAASVGSWRTLLRAAPGEKKLGDLPLAERVALLASLVESFHQLTIHPDFAGTPQDQYIGKIEDWIESLGLPRDFRLAAQISLVEYGEFATPDEIEQFTPSNVIELIKVVAAKKEWERRIAARNYRKQTPGSAVQPRADEPTEADLLIGREVLAGMTARNPSVASFRDAVRAKGHKASDTKLGKLFKTLKAERQK